MTPAILLRRFAAIAVAALVGLTALPAAANQTDFATWLAGVRQDAIAAGIKPVTVDRASPG